MVAAFDRLDVEERTDTDEGKVGVRVIFSSISQNLPDTEGSGAPRSEKVRITSSKSANSAYDASV